VQLCHHEKHAALTSGAGYLAGCFRQSQRGSYVRDFTIPVFRSWKTCRLASSRRRAVLDRSQEMVRGSVERLFERGPVLTGDDRLQSLSRASRTQRLSFLPSLWLFSSAGEPRFANELRLKAREGLRELASTSRRLLGGGDVVIGGDMNEAWKTPCERPEQLHQISCSYPCRTAPTAAVNDDQ